MLIEQSIQTANILIEKLSEVIKGRDDTIKLVLTGLFANGHILIEDYPGSGKTTLAKTLGNLIDCSDNAQIESFRRIQFTPDLLPSDVLGVTIFEPQSSTFKFQQGPVFSHIVLADEINRTGPKVQAAFLECMAERQVTIDNNTYKLDDLFFVIGTQNPLDLAGTYPLPLVQLDRFLLKLPMGYVDAETELEIIKTSAEIESKSRVVNPVVSRSDIVNAQKQINEINLSEDLLKAIVNIVQDSRDNQQLIHGASTRAAIMLKKAVAAWALVNGRDYANEDDLKYISPFVLKHRFKFAPGIDGSEVFSDIIKPHIEELIRAGA